MVDTPDAMKDLTSLLPDQFSGLLSKASAAAAPEYEKITGAEKEFAKTKGDLGIKKAEAEAKYAKAGIGAEQGVYKKFEKQLMEPAPTIQYNQETSKSMTSLATLLPVAAMMFGNKSQLSAIGAMNAMSGVLEGHQQGNQERIALETKNFEQKMNEFKTHQEQIKGAFERALQAAKLNASAAQAGLKVELAKLDAQLLNAEVDQKGVTRAAMDNLQRIDNVTKAVEQSLTKLNAEKPENYTVNGQTRLMLPSEAVAMEKAGATVVKTGSIRTATIKDPAQHDMVTKALGVDLGVDAGSAAQIAASMAESASLAKYVKDNPEVMGRSGQIKGFIDRYISSWNSGDTSQIDAEANKADPETQKALLFAKRYAKFLTDYERAVAGGARGFTVNLQQRYNQLMSSGQFNPSSFIELMREHSKEIASGATQLGEGITYDKLMGLGGTIRSNAGDNTVNEAITFLKGGQAAAPAAPANSVYKSIDDVTAAYNAGKIDYDSAEKILKEQFGVQ